MKLLRPDGVGVVIDVALSRVDALWQRMDVEFFDAVGHMSVDPKQSDPVLVVGFNQYRKAEVVSKLRVEEVDVRRDTYLVFEFGDDLADEIVLLYLQ